MSLKSFSSWLESRAVGEQPLNHVPADIPQAGLVVSTILSMLTMSVLAVCFTRRVQATRNWEKIPLTRWLVLIIYADSMIFIFTTALIEHGFGLNSNITICSSAILICLTCYLSTKLIFYFLVEKVYIIRSVSTPRLKSKLYCLNVFGLLLPYVIVIILNFIYRTAYFTTDGTCIIGMEKKSVMPLIIFDALINFYLTLLFVVPLRKLYSYKNTPNSALRVVAIRSFFGSLATLTSSVVNLTVLMILKGEAAWICLMCCNADILFSVLVLHWITSKDSTGGTSNHSVTSPRSHHAGRKTLGSDGGTLSPGSAGRTDRFENFGQSKGLEVGTVTTHITAENTGNKNDEDLEEGMYGERLTKKSSGKNYEENNFPMGRIQVRVGQVVEVERGAKSDYSNVSEGEDVTDFTRGERPVSTEDLVRRS